MKHLAEQQQLNALFSRGVASLDDESQLAEIASALRELADPAARFGATLFDLTLAKSGDEVARLRMKSIAAQLLRFWSDGTGQAMSKAHPVLAPLWNQASGLLISFELAQLREALHTCFEVRHDAAALQEAMRGLKPEGHRRVEFALCIYSLELARMSVDGARAAFSKRAGLLAEAYQSEEVADELIGHNAGLRALWAELVPYLDEFFEMVEEQQAPASSPSGESLRPPSPSAITDEAQTPPGGLFSTEIIRPDDDFVDAAEIFEPPAFTSSDSLIEADVEVELTDEATVAPPALPPPLPSSESIGSPSRITSETPDYEPTLESLHFWKATFEFLQLSGGDKGRTAQRLLSTESRTDRKRLNEFLTQLGPFENVPEARAFGCLLRLMMAGQLKEKSLFGSPNGRRAEAFTFAFADLHKSADAAARAAVWFALDGPETQQALHRGLDGLTRFLTYCARSKLDPLSEKARQQFEQHVLA